MPRKIITINVAQRSWIKAEAKRLGITATELIRRLIDKARGETY